MFSNSSIRSYDEEENKLSLSCDCENWCSAISTTSSHTSHLRLSSYLRDEIPYHPRQHQQQHQQRQRPSSGRTIYMNKQYKNISSRSLHLRRCQSQERLNHSIQKEMPISSFPNKLTLDNCKPKPTPNPSFIIKNNRNNNKPKISPSKGVERKLASHFNTAAPNELDDLIDEYVPDSNNISTNVICKKQYGGSSNIIKRSVAFSNSPCTLKIDTRLPGALAVNEENYSTNSTITNTNDEKAIEMAKQSLKEEMEEFIKSGMKYIKYPEYIRDQEVSLILDVAREFNLGIEEGTKSTFVYRLSTEGGELKDLAVDTFFDISLSIRDFRSENHSALQRLNSFKGNRRSMLSKLATTPTIKVPIGNEACTNGVYMVKTKDNGNNIAMYKPIQEEKFIRRGIDVGEGAVREEAAYVLDYTGFSRVPPTTVASINRNDSSGAIQQFMLSKMGSLENFGMPGRLEEAIKFVSIQEIQRIAILDVRVFNTDRHLGNVLLLGEQAPYGLVPIDHGCILPSWYTLGEAEFGWLSFPQIKQPLTDESVSYIININIEEDIKKLRQLKIREECIATLKICTTLLKMTAKNKKTLFWLGNFMHRHDCMDQPSELEKLIKQACDICHISLSFEQNEYGEYESKIGHFGIFSRRPPQQFYEVISQLFHQILLNEN